jgi:hypothetical protein
MHVVQVDILEVTQDQSPRDETDRLRHRIAKRTMLTDGAT